MITVLRARGIGEPISGDSQMLGNVTLLLDKARFVIKNVPWSAQYGPAPTPLGESFTVALEHGRTRLLNMIYDDPNPVVMLGYSGGAALVGNVAAEIGLGLWPELDVRGVGLIADPCRSPVNSVNPGAVDFGVARARAVVAPFPVWQLADPADAIPCCPPNSPFRTFSDESAAFSLIDPAAWGRDLYGRIETHHMQDVNSHIADYARALWDLDGYLRRGDHTSYHRRAFPGTNRTYCGWLADRINEIRE